jgi:hypothetical protein
MSTSWWCEPRSRRTYTQLYLQHHHSKEKSGRHSYITRNDVYTYNYVKNFMNDGLQHHSFLMKDILFVCCFLRQEVQNYTSLACGHSKNDSCEVVRSTVGVRGREGCQEKVAL